MGLHKTGWDDPDVFYKPGEFGLEIIDVVEEPNLCYEFCMVGIWGDPETRQVYFGRDSGCSCPSPFESMGRDDLTELTDETYAELEALLRENWKEKYTFDQADATEALAKATAYARA